MLHCYLYFHLKYIMISIIESTIPFVPIMGKSLIRMPYSSQRDTFRNKKNKVSEDRSFVDFVFQIFITCGKKVIVETKPAAVPINPIKVSGIKKNLNGCYKFFPFAYLLAPHGIVQSFFCK